MSPIAEMIESEKDKSADKSRGSERDKRINGYLKSWTKNTNLRHMDEMTDFGNDELKPTTTLDKLREETRSLGSRGWWDRADVAIAFDVIHDGYKDFDGDKDFVSRIDPLIDGFYDFVTQEIDSSIPKAVIVEEFIGSCRDIVDAPEEIFEEIKQEDPNRGMAAIIDLLSDKISEIASRNKRVRIKHAVAKKAIAVAI